MNPAIPILILVALIALFFFAKLLHKITSIPLTCPKCKKRTMTANYDPVLYKFIYKCKKCSETVRPPGL